MGAFSRKVARAFGYDIMRFKKSSSFDASLERLLDHHNFDAVIDVGANIGLFSEYCLRGIGDIPVYAFEPTDELAENLEKKAARQPRWHIVRVALGDVSGEALLNISASKSVFNSLNAANPDFATSVDGLIFDRQQTVRVSTLDQYAAEHGLTAYQNMLVKIDTQGHDLKVLKGAAKTLLQARAVIVELPFQNIYASNDSYDAIFDIMSTLGFSLYAIAPISNDAKGALIEADGFFVRR